MKKYTLFIVLLFAIGSVLVACGEESNVTPNESDNVNEEEANISNGEEEEAEKEIQEEEAEKINLSLSEFKDNWNTLLNNVESDLMDHFIIDEFIDINDGEAFRYVLESGLNIEGFKHDDDEIREIYINSDEDSFNSDAFPHAMAYGIFIRALDPEMNEHNSGLILINDLGFDEDMSFVIESQEISFDDYKLSLTYYSYMDVVRLSATPLE